MIQRYVHIYSFVHDSNILYLAGTDSDLIKGGALVSEVVLYTSLSI